MNPKDAIASSANKVNLALVPPDAEEALARAMMDGARKYGPWNWRAIDTGVYASVYIAACKRHLAAWFRGEERADDSGVHHLGHAMACLAILLDARVNGCLHDDRPPRADIQWDEASATEAREVSERERAAAIAKWMKEQQDKTPSSPYPPYYCD